MLQGNKTATKVLRCYTLRDIAFLENIVSATCPMNFNLMNFVLHEYKSTRHERTLRCIFYCFWTCWCELILVILSLLPVPAMCPSVRTTRVFCLFNLSLQHVPSCFTTLNFQSRWVHPWHCSPNPGGGKKISVPWERGGGWDCQVLHWAQPLRGGN